MHFLKLLLVPIFAFSFDLEFSKKFEHELPRDTLTTNIKITIEDDTEIRVGDRLEVFDQKIKSFDKVSKVFGNLNIRPIYRHALNTPKIKGYIGELKYKVNSRKARYIDEFIREVTKLKRNRDTIVSVSNLKWSVKDDAFNVTLDLLRLESINWINNYSLNLSSDLGKSCLVKNINIDNQKQLMSLNTNKIYSNETASTETLPIPQSNLEKIVIFADYKLECK